VRNRFRQKSAKSIFYFSDYRPEIRIPANPATIITDPEKLPKKKGLRRLPCRCMATNCLNIFHKSPDL
jgi:hypothetical protein